MFDSDIVGEIEGGGSSGVSDDSGGGGASGSGSGIAQGGIPGEMAGNLFSGILNYASAKSARDYNYHMASTAHQREVADLEAAGLNPILSATGGSGASTGAPAPVVTFDNPARGLAQTMMNRASVEQQIANSKADIATKQASARNLEEQTRTQLTQQLANSASAARDLSVKDLNDIQQGKVNADIGVANAQKARIGMDTYMSALDASAEEKRTQIYRTDAGFLAGVLDYLKTFVPFLGASSTFLHDSRSR